MKQAKQMQITIPVFLAYEKYMFGPVSSEKIQFKSMIYYVVIFEILSIESEKKAITFFSHYKYISVRRRRTNVFSRNKYGEKRV